VQVLENGIRGPLIPLLLDPLLRRQQIDELFHASVQETPSALNVPDQAVRLVLRGHPQAANAGVDAIRKREIDDAELAAKRHGRLRAPVGDLLEPAAAAASQYQTVRVACDDADETQVGPAWDCVRWLLVFVHG